MQIVSILRLLWRRRLLVLMGFAFALPVGLLLSYDVQGGVPPTFESRQYKTGIASAAALVDSNKSQVVDLGGGTDAAQLSLRARLLANLMATSPLREQIAQAANVRPEWFIAHRPPEGGPATLRTPEGPGAAISESDRRATVLRLHVNETLPIITAEVEAPDAPTAKRVATASITELRNYLATVAAGKIPDGRKLVVTPLGQARSATETRGRAPLLGVLLFILVFGTWCASIVGISGLARAWRETVAEEDDARGAAPVLAPPQRPSDSSGRARVFPGARQATQRQSPEAPSRSEASPPGPSGATEPRLGAMTHSQRMQRDDPSRRAS